MIIQENIVLDSYTWFGVGGAARYFCAPVQEEEFTEACAFAREHSIPLHILGGGANVLISDSGVDGVVVHPGHTKIEVAPCPNDSAYCLITAGAGAEMQAVIDTALSAHAIGLEVFSGIPGTVGGAVYINLHYFEAFLADFFVQGTVIDSKTGEVTVRDAAWFCFGYDTSIVQEKKVIVYDATFRVRKGTAEETAYARGRRDEIIRQRQRRYPKERTCGSFFQNCTKDAPYLHHIQGTPVRSIAWYLDRLGIKGTLAENGARVSVQHANMFVTEETATARDVIRLACRIQQMMQEHFGFMPQPECQFIGFSDYPLLDKKREFSAENSA